MNKFLVLISIRKCFIKNKSRSSWYGHEILWKGVCSITVDTERIISMPLIKDETKVYSERGGMIFKWPLNSNMFLECPVIKGDIFLLEWVKAWRAHCSNLVYMLLGHAPQWQNHSCPGRAKMVKGTLGHHCHLFIHQKAWAQQHPQATDCSFIGSAPSSRKRNILVPGLTSPPLTYTSCTSILSI